MRTQLLLIHVDDVATSDDAGLFLMMTMMMMPMLLMILLSMLLRILEAAMDDEG